MMLEKKILVIDLHKLQKYQLGVNLKWLHFVFHSKYDSIMERHPTKEKHRKCLYTSILYAFISVQRQFHNDISSSLKTTIKYMLPIRNLSFNLTNSQLSIQWSILWQTSIIGPARIRCWSWSGSWILKI